MIERIPRATFAQMFGKYKTEKWRTLSDVCETITDGTHYTPTYAGEGYVFLSAKNVTSGYIDWNNVKYVSEELHNELQKRVSPTRGDILLAKNGTTGVAAIVDKDEVFDIYVSLALLRPSKLILSEFLLHAINSGGSLRQFNSHLKGIGVPNLHLVDIRKTKIPIATMTEQLEFVKNLRAVLQLKADAEEGLSLANSLFASLQHRAYRGEL